MPLDESRTAITPHPFLVCVGNPYGDRRWQRVMTARPSFSRRLAALKAAALTAGPEPAFAHNDVLCGNVMVRRQTGDISLG